MLHARKYHTLCYRPRRNFFLFDLCLLAIKTYSSCFLCYDSCPLYSFHSVYWCIASEDIVNCIFQCRLMILIEKEKAMHNMVRLMGRVDSVQNKLSDRPFVFFDRIIDNSDLLHLVKASFSSASK